MLRCINISLDEVKQISSKLYVDLKLTGNLIGSWQEANNTDEFPVVFNGELVKKTELIGEIKIDSNFKSKLTGILKGLGVELNEVDNLIYDNKNINGSFDSLSKIVNISLNQEVADTLSEETSHVVVSYLKSIKSPLYNSMMMDIDKYEIYKSVFNDYYESYSGNIEKIKEEAIGKAISFYLMKNETKNEEVLNLIEKDLSNTKLIDRINNWFKRVLNEFKNRLQSFGVKSYNDFENYFDLVSKLAIDSNFNDKDWKTNGDVYLQLSSYPKNIQETLNKLKNDKENVEIKEEVSDSGDIREKYFNKLLNKFIKFRVSDLVKNSKFNEDIKSDSRKKTESTRSKYGTLVHDDLRKAFDNSTESFSTPFGNKFISFAKEIKGQFDKNSIFLTEQFIYDPLYSSGSGIGGTIDLLVLEPFEVNGVKKWKAHILDWKLIGNLDKVSIESRKKDYAIQLSNYIKILKDTYGIENIGQSRMIPINGIYKKNGDNETLESIEIGNNKVIDVDGLEYLEPLPLLTENTNDNKINHKLSFLREQLKKEKDKDRAKLIKETIARLQISSDINEFNKIMENDSLVIERLISYSENRKLSNEELVSLSKLSEFYSDNINPELKDKISNLILTHGFELTVDDLTEETIIDFDKPIKEIGFAERFYQLSKIDSPIFQHFYKIIRGGKYEVQKKVKEIADKLEVIKLQIIKENGSLEKGFDKIINKKTGNLISKVSQEWYEDIKNDRVDSRLFDSLSYLQKESELMESWKKQNPINADNPKSIASQKKYYKKLYGSLNANSKFWNYESNLFKKYLTREYNEISSKDTGLLKLYNLYAEINIIASDSSEYNVRKNFLPAITKSLSKQMLEMNIGSVWNNAMEEISLHNWTNFELDENGNKIYKVPLKYFQKNKDVSIQSYDLNKMLLQWTESVYTNKYLNESENTIKLLEFALKKSKQLITKDGKVLKNESGDLQTKLVSSETLDVFKEYIEQEVYGVTSKSDEISIFGKSLNKIIKKGLSYTSGNSLFGNVLSALSNVTGGFSNAISVGAKKNAFTNEQLGKAVIDFGSGNGKKRAIMAYFEIDNNTYDSDLYKKYSIDTLSRIVNWDNTFILNQFGDKKIQNTILLAMMRNHTVKDGKIVKKTELDKDLIDLTEIKNDKLLFPVSDYELFLFRDYVKTINSEILGTTSDYNKSLIGNTLLGAMMLQYRRWILPLATSRFGKLNYDVSTSNYEIGKYNSSAKLLLNKRFFSIVKELIKNKNGFLLEGELLSLYKIELDKNPDLTYDEFKDLYMKNIKSLITELILFLSISALMYGVDDDDEGNAEQKFMSKVLGRTANELSFWYNPISFTTIIKSPVPLINPLVTLLELFGNGLKLPFEYFFDDSEQIDKTIDKIENKSIKLTFGFNAYNKILELIEE